MGRDGLISNGQVNVLQVINRLWAGRGLVLCSALLGAVSAIIYIMLSVPLYQAMIIVDAPSKKDISHLNVGRGDSENLPSLTTEEVFSIYLRSLESESLRRDFFYTAYIPSSRNSQGKSIEQLYAKFKKVLWVMPIGGKDIPRFAILAKDTDPRQAVDWVRRYAQMVNDQVKESLLTDLEGDALARADTLEWEVNNARASAKRQREDEITKLYESLAIAKELGLEDLPTKEQLLRIMPFAYLRGSRALTAEIEALERRTSDDPYIEGLREQEAKLDFYRELKIDSSLVVFYRQDGVAQIPDKPLGPNSLLTFLLGLALGLIIGAVFAIFRHLPRDI